MMAFVDMARKPAPAGFQLLCGEMYVLSLIKRLQYHESQFSGDGLTYLCTRDHGLLFCNVSNTILQWKAPVASKIVEWH